MDLVPQYAVWIPDPPIDLPSQQQHEPRIAGCWLVPPLQACELPPPVAFEPDPWFTKPEGPEQGETSSDPLGFGDSDPAASDPAAIDPLTGLGQASPVEPPCSDGSLQEPAPTTDVQDEPSTADPTFAPSAENQVDWTIGPIYSMTLTVNNESYVGFDYILPTSSESDDLNSFPASFADFTAVESATLELSLSGESSLEAPILVSCEACPCPPATDPVAELTENDQGLTVQADDELLEVVLLAGGSEPSDSIVPSELIRYIKPYYRTQVAVEESGDGLNESFSGPDRSVYTLPQPDENSAHQPFSPIVVDASGELPAPLVLNIGESVIAADPRQSRDAIADLYSDYLAFLQSNPQWLDDHGATGLQPQVMTPSSFLPSFDLPTPGAARAFDAWYEHTHLSNGAVCHFFYSEPPPLPLFDPPPGVTSTPGELPAFSEISSPVPIRSEPPAPPPITVLTSSEVPPESASAPERITLFPGDSAAALILSIPEEPAAAAISLAAASPPATLAPVAVIIPPSPVGESDLLLARRRREEAAEMTPLSLG